MFRSNPTLFKYVLDLVAIVSLYYAVVGVVSLICGN